MDDITRCRVISGVNADIKTLQRSSFHKPFHYKQKCTGMYPWRHIPPEFSPPRYPETVLDIKTNQNKSNKGESSYKFIFYKCKMSDYNTAIKHV